MKTTEQKVPALRFPEFEGDWEEKKLGEVCEKKSSNLSQSELELNNGIYKVYGASGFLKYIDFYLIEKPYIGIVKDGAGVGRMFLCEKESSVLGTLDIIINRENSDIEFLYYFMNQINFEKYSIGSTIPHIYFKDYSKEKLKFPSLEEQTQIADFLSATDKRLELLKEKKQGLEDYKRGAMQRIFSQELRFTRADGSAYEDWEEKKLGEVLFIKTPIVAEVIDPTKILTVRLHQKGVHPSNISQYYNVGATKYYVREKGDFIFGKQNIFNGAFAIIPDEFDSFITSGDIPSLGVKPLLNSKYLICFLSNDYFYKTLESLSIGTGSKRLHEKEFLRVKINLPSLPEQTQIANFLSAINVKIEKLSEQIEVTENYKKGLLQQMFV